MTDASSIAEGLSEAQRAALVQFEPGKWYGTAQPSREASFCKGKLCDKDILEHDEGAPYTHYRLTPLGLSLRNHLQQGSDT